MQAVLQTILSPYECSIFRQDSDGKPIIALWATIDPRPTLDVILRLHEMLRANRYHVVLLLRKNASASFLAQCPEPNYPVYVFDDVTLLEHCPFELLITHDYCVRQKPPAGFTGKVLLLPHNIHIPSPHGGNFWADYLVTPNTEIGPFNYDFLPTSIKRHRSPFLTMIPCGYPKLDLLIRARQGQGPHKLAAFFPVSLWYSIGQDTRKEELASRRWSEMLELFFNAYPDWTFVVRPYKEDRNHPLFLMLCERFSGKAGFIFDTDEDNKRYLITADVFITDYSAVDLNFSFATLRPSISLSLDDKEHQTFIKDETGYTAYSGQQVLAAIEDAATHKVFWEKKIARLRREKIPYAGKCYEYLIEHMESILWDEPNPDWVVVDKGNTPFTTVEEWEFLFSSHSGLTIQSASPHQYYQWSRELMGDAPRIGLAFLGYAFRTMPALAEGQDRYLLPYIEQSIESILLYVPAQDVLSLLWRLYQQNTTNVFVLDWLLIATIRFNANVNDVNHVLCLYAERKISLEIIKKIYTSGIDSEILYLILDHSLDICSKYVEPEIFFIYSMLLIKHNRYSKCKMVMRLWKRSKSITPDFEKHYEMLLYFLKIKNHRELPQLFNVNGKFNANICGIPMSFNSKQHAVGLFGEEIQTHLFKKPASHFLKFIFKNVIRIFKFEKS